MKILVTGSNGLLGQKLISLCLERGTPVVATSQGENRFQQATEYYTMDITNAEEVMRVISRVQPNVVINTAAMTNVDQCETEQDQCMKLNVEGVEHLISACVTNHCFLVHLSTDFIFDGSHGPLKEDENPQPINFYGESKLMSERLLQESHIDWAIARTVLVYGIVPRMSRSNIILWVKNKLEAGEEIQVVDDQYRTPTLAEDLAEGCYRIATKKAKGIWNISGKDMLTPYQMALKTAEFFNLDVNLIRRTDSSHFKQPAARPLKTGFVITKAQSQLGYNPHTFDEGLQWIANQITQ